MTRRCRKPLAVLLAALCATAAVAEPVGLAATIAADPHLATIPRTQSERARIAAVTAAAQDFTAAKPFEANPGGAGSVRRRPDAQAFSLPQENLSFAQRSTFSIGNGLFERLWVTAPASTIASDGLGPLFNARSCQNCHVKDGRGRAPAGPDDRATSTVVRLGIPQVSARTPSPATSVRRPIRPTATSSPTSPSPGSTPRAGSASTGRRPGRWRCPVARRSRCAARTGRWRRWPTARSTRPPP